MSFHRCSFSGESSTGMPALELFDRSSSEDQIDTSAAGAVFNLELRHLAASVRVVAAHEAPSESGVRIGGIANGVQAFLSFNAEPRQLSTCESDCFERDTLVKQLSEALLAAQHDQTEFAGIFADAVKLATVAKMVSSYADAKATGAPGATSVGLAKWRLRLVAKYIEAHLDEKVTLADMAAAARLSRMHFAALFFRATGVRPHAYLLRQRIRAAQKMLQTTDKSIVEIAMSVGFQTQAHFTTVFKRYSGQTPAKWRKGRLMRVNVYQEISLAECALTPIERFS
ncbi:helix-turn-helix domain-containing protein [Bradyrhizobium diazoefficiens]